VHAARSGHITPLTYLLPILSAIRSYEFSELRIVCETDDNASTKFSTSARWAFVSNLPCYAGGLKPGCGASGTDGQLDLCTFARGGLLPALKYLPRLMTGTQGNLRECILRRSRRIRIDSNRHVPYEVDGDPGGTLPVDIDVLPKRLTLVVPSSFLERGIAT
jgi:diacylglycerol kinase family enzyme